MCVCMCVFSCLRIFIYSTTIYVESKHIEKSVMLAYSHLRLPEKWSMFYDCMRHGEIPDPLKSMTKLPLSSRESGFFPFCLYRQLGKVPGLLKVIPLSSIPRAPHERIPDCWSEMLVNESMMGRCG